MITVAGLIIVITFCVVIHYRTVILGRRIQDLETAYQGLSKAENIMRRALLGIERPLRSVASNGGRPPPWWRTVLHAPGLLVLVVCAIALTLHLSGQSDSDARYSWSDEPESAEEAAPNTATSIAPIDNAHPSSQTPQTTTTTPPAPPPAVEVDQSPTPVGPPPAPTTEPATEPAAPAPVETTTTTAPPPSTTSTTSIPAAPLEDPEVEPGRAPGIPPGVGGGAVGPVLR